MKKSTATFYPKTRYGAKTTNEGPLCTLHLEALDVPPLYAMEHKSVTFVVDLSGSMEDTLPHVKMSLLAFRSVLFPMNMPKSREIASRWRHNLNIVTFSDTASHLWSSKSCKTFEEAVMSMEISDATNMGAGIEMAFALARENPNKATWIVVLTDGVSNAGMYQTPESFAFLAKLAPLNTKLVTIGYGDNFDPNILNALGDFSHLKGVEDIPVLMGALAHEVSTASMFGVKIDMGENMGENRSETKSETKSEIKIGQTFVGVLSTGREFIFGFVPCYSSMEKLQNLIVQGTCITEHGLQHVFEMDIFSSASALFRPLWTCDYSPEAPENIRRAFYASATAKMLLETFHSKNSEGQILKRIKHEVGLWTDKCAIESKETLLRIASEWASNRKQVDAIHFASSATKQNSLVIQTLQTPGAKSASMQSSNLVRRAEGAASDTLE
jgi:hypothetical protein